MDPFYSDSNMADIKKSIEQIRSGKTVEMSLENIDR